MSRDSCAWIAHPPDQVEKFEYDMGCWNSNPYQRFWMQIRCDRPIEAKAVKIYFFLGAPPEIRVKEVNNNTKVSTLRPTAHGGRRRKVEGRSGRRGLKGGWRQSATLWRRHV